MLLNDTKDIKEKPSINFGKLRGYLGYQSRQLQSAVFRDFVRITEEVGVTPGEFSLLVIVGSNPGINQITLTKIYQLDKSTLSYSVNGLKKRGLIKRTRSPQDRRYFNLWLTNNGRVVLKRTTQLIEEQERVMDAVLKPGERELLLDLTARVSRAFG